jgi:hypothetical protein
VPLHISYPYFYYQTISTTDKFGKPQDAENIPGKVLGDHHFWKKITGHHEIEILMH